MSLVVMEIIAPVFVPQNFVAIVGIVLGMKDVMEDFAIRDTDAQVQIKTKIYSEPITTSLLIINQMSTKQ